MHVSQRLDLCIIVCSSQRAIYATYDIAVFLTSVLGDVVDDMMLMSSLQGFQKLATLFLCCKQIQYGFTSSVRCSPLTANIVILPTTEHLQPQQLIQQTEVWLDDVRKATL